MKFTSKALSMFLVLVLLVLPMAAFAEGTQKTMTINNIAVALNGGEPILLNIQMQNTLGVNADEAFFQMDIQSEEKPVVHANIAKEGKIIQAHVDGVEGVYQVTEDEITDFIKDQAGGEMPFDTKLLNDYIEAYVKLLSKIDEISKAPKQNSIELLKASGIQMEEKSEVAEVLGEQMELTRYDFTFGVSDLYKMIQEAAKSVPELKEFLDVYFDFMASVIAMDPSAQDVHFDKERPIESLFGEVGDQLIYTTTLWTDADEKNIRMEMVGNVTFHADAPEGEEGSESSEPIAIEVPITIEQKTDTDGTVHMKMYCEVDQEGFAVKMDCESHGNDEKGDFNFDFAVNDGSQTVQMQVGGTYDANAIEGQLTIDFGEGKVNVTLATETEDDVKHVKLGVAAGTPDGTPILSGIVSFDVKIEEAAMPDGTVISDESTVKEVFKLTDEEIENLMTQATTVAIMGYGQLMSNEGVLKLFGEVSALFVETVETDEGAIAA